MSRSTLARHLAVRRLADPRPASPGPAGAPAADPVPVADQLAVQRPDAGGAVLDDGVAVGPLRPPRRPAVRPERCPSSRGARAWRRLRDDDAGMSTVEYAIGCVAAAAFAAVLYGIVSGESVVTALTELVQRALSTEF